MPPRNPPTSRDKREELKTYRELELRRDLKSIRQRRRVEATGLRRVLGDGSSGQPYLIVETRRYRQVRLGIQRKLLLQARKSGINLPVDILQRQLKPRIEALAYAQLAGEAGHHAMNQTPLPALGRALTPEEQTHFAASLAASETATDRGAGASARLALDQVMGHVEKRQTHNPARYQMLWAQVVGSDAAQQSYLDSVDPATATAWFRCFNSVLSSDLQRRPALAKKLAAALGIPVRQLRARF